MRSQLLIAGAVTLVSTLTFVFISKGDPKMIRVGLDRHWVNLHPGLQHVRNGDLVLSNQFDALVGIDEAGLPAPLGAKSWTISPDFRIFEFRIDTTLRYSDGSMLKSADFKRSWEESLRLEPKSENSSLRDVLYKIVGFNDFGKTFSISGIEVPDDSTLRITFNSPFRIALDYLSGNRYSAYKKVGSQYIGTGRYIIEEKGKDELVLNPNPFSSSEELVPITINCLYTSSANEEALLEGKIDVIGPTRASPTMAGLLNSPSISNVIGQDAIHDFIAVNGLPGRIFNDPNMRLAFQSMVWDQLESGDTPFSGKARMGLFNFDPQVFLPLQKGRIEGARSAELVRAGSNHIFELLARTKKNPIKIGYAEDQTWFPAFLRRLGLTLDEKSVVPTKSMEDYYKHHHSDISLMGSSVSNGDPDGIYHLLGRSGAITSSMIQRASVADLLEKGRDILDSAKVDKHYKHVSEAILNSVPFVHLGFSKTVAFYNNGQIEVDTKIIRRNEGHLHLFRLKD